MTQPTTLRQDTITLALVAWLILGIFLDGYAHVYVIDTATEDFFTLWHANFYAAFTFVTAWIAWIGYQRRHPGRLLDWFPPSHRPALAGLGLFGLGGVGDGVWHTAFGIEVGIDALLSPTHLLLFAGAVLILWTPVRSSADRGDSGPWLAVGTAIVATALIVFFVQYLWYLPYPYFARQTFDSATGAGQGAVQQFFGGAVVATLVLLGPLLLVAGQWRLPFGAATLVWTTAQTLESLSFSQEYWAIGLAAAGGLAFDLAYLASRRWSWSLMAAAMIGPLVLWASYLVAAARGGLGWPPEISGGLLFITAFCGAGSVLLQRSGASLPSADGETF